MAHLIVRSYQTMDAQHAWPDPFHGLSGYERVRLLTAPPTWWERWTLCNPELSRVDRQAVLVELLLARRAAYDREFADRCGAARRARIAHCYETGQPFPYSREVLATTALQAWRAQREADDEREARLREAFYQRRLAPPVVTRQRTGRRR
jgi:hypothetical protein